METESKKGFVLGHRIYKHVCHRKGRHSEECWIVGEGEVLTDGQVWRDIKIKALR